MQAIITKYIPATNFRGSRYRAKCARGSMLVSVPPEIDTSDAHAYAAKTLCEKFDKEDQEKYGSEPIGPWMKPFYSGSLPSGECVHVFAVPAYKTTVKPS